MKLIFFFSSRRRHTRWPRDWSSDVCSSDLPACSGDFAAAEDHVDDVVFGVDDEDEGHVHDDESGEEDQPDEVQGTSEIGRASCRGREEIVVEIVKLWRKKGEEIQTRAVMIE